MAATSKALTEPEYLSRKGVLQAHRVAAEQEHARQAYAAYVGEDGADPDRAKQNLDLIDQQLLGLEAVWREAQQRAAKEARRIDAKARTDRLKRIDGHLSDRAKAAAAIERALQPLEASLKDYREASAKIVDELRAHQGEFGDFVTSVRWVVEPAPDPTPRLIAGHLFKAGIDLRNIEGREASFFVDDRGGLAQWVKDQNRRIERVAEVIAPSEVEPA